MAPSFYIAGNARFMGSVNTPAIGTASISDILIPGGGYSIGFDMHADGTMLSQVDIFGGYVGNTVVGSTWAQVATQLSMPSAYTTPPTPFLHGGTWAVRIAPSNSSVMYMMYLGNINQQTLCTLLKSTNKGVTWATTGFTNFAGNLFDGTRAQQGQRIVVDPINSDVVYASTYTHLYASTDGGTTFNQVDGGGSGLPAPVSPGCVAMQYDPTGGSTGGKSNRLIVGVSGSGVYVSTNAFNGSTSTWTLVTGSPTNPAHGKMGSDGNYYFSRINQANALLRVDTSSTLTTFTPASAGVDTFDIDPNNPARVATLRFGQLTVGGPVNGSPAFTTSTGSPSFFDLASSTTQPWFANAHNGGSGDTGPKTPGGLYFDPFVTTASDTVTIGTGTKNFTVAAGLNLVVGDLLRVTNTGAPANYMQGTISSYSGTALSISVLSTAPGGYLGGVTGGSGTFSAWTITKERLWYSTGVAMFWTDGLWTQTGSATMHWQPASLGIEDMVCKDVIWPVGGKPVAAVSDRGVWKVEANPVGATAGLSGYGPRYATELIEGTGIDWASNDGTFIGTVGNVLSGFSTTGGTPGVANWTAFANAPPNSTSSVCGIAVASSNFMLAYTSSGLYYTLNGGSSAWTLVPTVPTSGWAGVANTTGIQPKPICADRVNIGTFYAYSQTNSTLWKIVLNGGVTVTSQHVGSLSSGTNGGMLKLRAVPGKAGHLFFSIGSNESAATYTNLGTVTAFTPSGYPLARSTDAGATWTNVTNVQMALFGFSAAKPGGGGYPAIHMAGWLSGVYGIYRSDDFDLFPSNTWTQIGTYARGWIDIPTCMEGDPNQWGRFIIGHNGSSYAIGQVSGQPNTWP